jgi:spermidine synthase
VAVLGAGACTLPAYLHAAFSDVAFVAVELSEEVVLIARDHFHVDALEASGRFLLHRGCAFEWAERQSEAHGFNQALDTICIQDGHQSHNSRTGKWDVVVVDLQFGPAVCGGLIAPPARALTSESLHLFDSLLAQGGAIVFNSVGTEQCVRDAARAAKASALCWVPGSAPGDDADVVVHAVFFRLHGGHGGSHDGNVDAAHVRLRLDSLPHLVDDADAWLSNWECLSTSS